MLLVNKKFVISYWRVCFWSLRVVLSIKKGVFIDELKYIKLFLKICYKYNIIIVLISIND